MISMDDSNRGDEDDHLTVTFETVLFSGIRQLANKSLNQTMAAIIDAGGAGNSLEIHGCHFTNILFEASIVSQTKSQSIPAVPAKVSHKVSTLFSECG